MKLFVIQCYNDADYPSSGTYFSKLVLANTLDEAIEMVRPKVDTIFPSDGSDAYELDLDKISRMRKPRIIA